VNAEAGIPCPECGQHYLKDSDLATHRAKRHGASMYWVCVWKIWNLKMKFGKNKLKRKHVEIVLFILPVLSLLRGNEFLNTTVNQRAPLRDQRHLALS